MHRMERLPPPPPPPSPLPSLPSLPGVHSFLIKTEPLPSLPSVLHALPIHHQFPLGAAYPEQLHYHHLHQHPHQQDQYQQDPHHHHPPYFPPNQPQVGIAALLNPAADDKRAVRQYMQASAPRPAAPTYFPTDPMVGVPPVAPVRSQKQPTAFRDSAGSSTSFNDSEGAVVEDKPFAQTPRPKKKRKARICKTEGCEKYVVDRGLCIRHGGGKRCSVDGCNCRAQNRGLCWKHGGYTRCTVEGCTKRAKSRGICWSHGGGTRCKHVGCAKIAVSHGLCWAHGGGKRCLVDGCQKPAYERNGNLCAEHCQDTSPQ